MIITSENWSSYYFEGNCFMLIENTFACNLTEAFLSLEANESFPPMNSFPINLTLTRINFRTNKWFWWMNFKILRCNFAYFQGLINLNQLHSAVRPQSLIHCLTELTHTVTHTDNLCLLHLIKTCDIDIQTKMINSNTKHYHSTISLLRKS